MLICATILTLVDYRECNRLGLLTLLRQAKDETGDKHIAPALHAILQRPGMPVNRITCSTVQIMVDMMRDLMERVMDEAAVCLCGQQRTCHNRAWKHQRGCQACFAQLHRQILPRQLSWDQDVHALVRIPALYQVPRLSVVGAEASKGNCDSNLRVKPLRVEPSPLPLPIRVDGAAWTRRR